MSALAGIRVLDLGLLVQGPQAGLLLAELGADVIKVELPGMGDQARWIPIAMDDLRFPYWEGCNRGKRSITLDLRTPGGKEAFLRLADTADVVLSNFKPGTLDGWGLGYDVLSERNPGVIYATGSTFGSAGPSAQQEGADLAGQAAGGLISTTGMDGTTPTPVGVTIADHIGSQNMTVGILSALFARTGTGRGQRVEVSLLGGQIYAQASEYTYTLMTGENPGRSNAGHPLLPMAYGVLPTADGHIALVGVLPDKREAFLEALGLPELVHDARFESPIMTTPVRLQLFELLGEATKTRTTAEWIEVFDAIGIRRAPVNDYVAAIDDPDVVANGYVVEATDPNGATRRVVGPPILLSDTPAQVHAVAPELGQNTEEILLEVGYDWDDIAALRDGGAI